MTTDELRLHLGVLEHAVGGHDALYNLAEDAFSNLSAQSDGIVRMLHDLRDRIDGLAGKRFEGHRPSRSALAKSRSRARCRGTVCGLEPGPCGVLEGELHRFGCDQERCTQCSGQFLYCDCSQPCEQRKRVPFFRLARTFGAVRCRLLRAPNSRQRNAFNFQIADAPSLLRPTEMGRHRSVRLRSARHKSGCAR